MTEEEAIQLYKDVLMGFLELVKNGIIHRDLKPANILINKGSYKLAGYYLFYKKKKILGSLSVLTISVNICLFLQLGLHFI